VSRVSGLRSSDQPGAEAFAPLQGPCVIGRAFGAGLRNFTPTILGLFGHRSLPQGDDEALRGGGRRWCSSPKPETRVFAPSSRFPLLRGRRVLACMSRRPAVCRQQDLRPLGGRLRPAVFGSLRPLRGLRRRIRRLADRRFSIGDFVLNPAVSCRDDCDQWRCATASCTLGAAGLPDEKATPPCC